MVLPVDFDEGEALLPRIRYKLENLYPAQREFAVCQLLNDVGLPFCATPVPWRISSRRCG